MSSSNLVDVLALELREELAEALVIGLDTDGVEDILDVAGARGGIPSKAQEKVCSKVLHFEACLCELR